MPAVSTRAWQVLFLLSSFVVLSFAPIYGSGENLIGINKLKHSAYEIYLDTLV